MAISNMYLFNISQGLGYVYFWISLAIPYLMYRGLSPVEALSLMSFYQLVGVFLEYPTGVLGDRFGYRRTLFLANTLNALAMVILAQNGPKYVYLLGLFVLAVGSGFSSGNNQGLLSRISANPRRDNANLSALAELVIFFSSIIGAYIGAISYELALYISAFAMFSANIPLYFLPSDRTSKSVVLPLKQIVSDGIKSLKNPIFAQIFLILAVFGGFFFSTKSIVGSFGRLYDLDIQSIGVIIGFSALFRAIGSKVYAHFQIISKHYLLILLVILILLMGLVQMPHLIYIIFIYHLSAGYLISAIDGDIHDHADLHIRSSLFSLKRLIMRLVSSIYLFIYGIFINQNLFSVLMICLGTLMAIATLLTLKYSRDTKRATHESL